MKSKEKLFYFRLEEGGDDWVLVTNDGRVLSYAKTIRDNALTELFSSRPEIIERIEKEFDDYELIDAFMFCLSGHLRGLRQRAAAYIREQLNGTIKSLETEVVERSFNQKVALYAISLDKRKSLWFLVTREGEILSEAETYELFKFTDLVYARAEIIEALADKYGIKGYELVTAEKALSQEEYEVLRASVLETLVKSTNQQPQDEAIEISLEPVEIDLEKLNPREKELIEYLNCGSFDHSSYWLGFKAGGLHAVNVLVSGADVKTITIPTYAPPLNEREA